MTRICLRTDLRIERLEDRLTPTVYVTNTLDYNPEFDPGIQSTYPEPGSLRWAIDQANKTPGGDVVEFNTNPANGTVFNDPLNPVTISLDYGSRRIGDWGYVDYNGLPVNIKGNPVQIRAPKYYDHSAPLVTLQLTGTLAKYDNIADELNQADWSAVAINYVGRKSDDSDDPGYQMPDYTKTVALDGVRITGGKAAHGAGIYAAGIFALEINHSEISANHAKRNFYYLAYESGTSGAGLETKPFILPGYGPKTAGFAPSVVVNRSLIMDNGTPEDADSIDPLPTPDVGGAMHLFAGTSLSMTESTVTLNTAEDGSAGIYFQGGGDDSGPINTVFEGSYGEFRYSSLSIIDSVFSKNEISSKKHDGSGGAITVHGTAVGFVAGTSFTSNAANTNGGAVELIEDLGNEDVIGQIHFYGCTFEGNKAAINNSKINGEHGVGGAISSIGRSNELFIVNCTFSGNNAEMGRGDAIYVESLQAPNHEHHIVVADYYEGSLTMPFGPQDPWDHKLRIRVYNSTIAKLNKADGVIDIDPFGNPTLMGGRGGGIAIDFSQGAGDFSIASSIIAENEVSPSTGEGRDV